MSLQGPLAVQELRGSATTTGTIFSMRPLGIQPHFCSGHHSCFVALWQIRALIFLRAECKEEVGRWPPSPPRGRALEAPCRAMQLHCQALSQLSPIRGV